MNLQQEVGDYRYKIIFLGDRGVGKTSLFIRIRDDKFVETSTQPTERGTDVFTYTTTVGEDRVTVDLWDTGQGERHRSSTCSYYRNAAAAILVYAVDDKVSCYDMHDWMHEAHMYIDDISNVTCTVWGNKSDLSYQEVQPREAKGSLCNNFSDIVDTMTFQLVSAKTGKQVKEVFEELIAATHKRLQRPVTKDNELIDLHRGPSGKQSKCC